MNKNIGHMFRLVLKSNKPCEKLLLREGLWNFCDEKVK